jgi:GAF domain-containing protein
MRVDSAARIEHMTSRRLPSADPAVAGAGRLRGLLDAHRAITDDLALAPLLDRIVATACELVGAKYGAIGVLGEDGMIEHFVYHGMDARTVARIGRLPKGRGLLGAALAAPGVVRLDDLTTDDRAAGLPAGYPAMRAFMGVPIRSRGVRFGELYLADPQPAKFTADDEELVVSFAGTAGRAIENARMYEDARRSRDWLNASGEIARALLADADVEVLLDVVSRSLRVAEADYAALVLPTDDGRMRVAVAKGLGAEFFQGHVFDPAESTLGKAILAAESFRTHDMTLWANLEFDNRFGFGPAMIVPLLDAQGSRGVVLLMRTADRVPFTARDVELASTFAAQVALALELNDTRADAEWVRVLEDRHQLAQDLHDNVMQRLFATGVGLQSMASQPLDEPVLERLRRYIQELDETIDEIRDRVFGLRGDAASDLARPRNRFPHVTKNVEPATD